MEEKANKIWDCESALYDSYELNSFKRQLDSAIANSARSLSMPHLREQRHHDFSHQPHHDQPPCFSSNSNKSNFKISRPFQKLLRFVFKSMSNSSSNNKSTISSGTNSDNYSLSSFKVAAEKYSNNSSKDQDRFYVVYDHKSHESQAVLSTIPELPEFDHIGGGGLSPEITNSFVTKSASERFTTTAIDISCA